MSDNDITAQLEALIDKHGLLHVLTGLECVCGEKADHITSNWQCKATARPWARAAKLIKGVALKTQI